MYLSFLFPPLWVFFLLMTGLNLTEVIGRYPFFSCFRWALLIKILRTVCISVSLSSILRFHAIYQILFLFCTRQIIPLSKIFFSFQTFLHASRSLRVSTPPHVISLFLTIHNYFFLIFFPFAYLVFLLLSFPVCSCSRSVSFFFLVEIMHMHIPYLHICSVLNCDKARRSHTFLRGTF